MGAHPVAFLNLGAVGGGTWAETRAQLAQVVAAGYLRHACLRSSEGMTAPNDAMRERRLRIPNREVAYLLRNEFAER
jgi:hypothetical protein